MTSGWIVEPLDVVEHICPGLVPGAIGFALGALGLQRREEALHRCVIPDVAGPAHAAQDAAVSHQALELFAGLGRIQTIVATAILFTHDSQSSSASAGVFHPSVFLGRALRTAATAVMSWTLWTLRSVPFGKY